MYNSSQQIILAIDQKQMAQTGCKFRIHHNVYLPYHSYYSNLNPAALLMIRLSTCPPPPHPVHLYQKRQAYLCNFGEGGDKDVPHHSKISDDPSLAHDLVSQHCSCCLMDIIHGNETQKHSPQSLNYLVHSRLMMIILQCNICGC